MKVIVFGGAGMMGRAVGWDLAKNCPEVTTIGLVDMKTEELQKVTEWINSDKVVKHVINVEDVEKVKDLMAIYDVGVLALNLCKATYILLETAIKVKFNLVDVIGEYYRKPSFTRGIERMGIIIPRPEGMTLEEYGESLHKRALNNGVTIIMGMGFSPGLTNVTCSEGINQMDKAEKAIAMCGGIPAKDCAHKYPLKYFILFGPDVKYKLLAHNNIGPMIKDGQLVDVRFYDDLELIKFNKLGHDEELEAYMTPSMPSFPYTRLSKVNEFYEKTIRWPGYVEGMKTLKECGLIEIVPIEIEPGDFISPIEVTSAVIKKKWMAKPGEIDVSILWDTVIGEKDGKKIRIDYYMWEEADSINFISAMARVTSFPASIATIMLGKGEIKKKGLIAPEDAIEGVLYNKMVKELAKRDIMIVEEITELE